MSYPWPTQTPPIPPQGDRDRERERDSRRYTHPQPRQHQLHQHHPQHFQVQYSPQLPQPQQRPATLQPPPPQLRRQPSLKSLTPQQQAYFEAYYHAIQTGRIPMPSITTNTVAKAQAAANHNQTISDPKKGVTYAGQDQLKRLPIPTLEETCQRYLESVRPFLVFFPCYPKLT
jgi:hypothetical protein